MVWVLCLALCCLLPFSLQAEARAQRHFLLIGAPDAAAWKYLMDNPDDRKAEVEGAFRAPGDEVLSDYFGLEDG